MRKERHIQSSLYRYLMGGIGIILLLYIAIQYIVFKSEHHKAFLKEVSHVEQTFQEILKNYKITLGKIAYEIKKNDLFGDKKRIEDLLRKAYAYGIENSGREKIRTSGINWVGVKGAELTPIGRLGKVKHALKLPPGYLKKLEKNWGELEFSDVLEVNNSSEFSFINLGIGVRDKNKKYSGFVNARINLSSLKEAVALKSEKNLQFILFNEKGQEVLSSLPQGTSINQHLGIGEYVQEIFRGRFFPRSYLFPLQITIEGSPFVLHFGYEQGQFYQLFLKQSYLSILLLWSALCFCSFFSYAYHKKFVKRSLIYYKESNRDKNLTITHLREENHQAAEREKRLENFINAADSSDKAEKNFCFEINERISLSLSKMLDIANVLLTKIQEEYKIEENSKGLMKVFEDTYAHSRFFTLKQEVMFLSINDILEEVFSIFSKQVLKKNLRITYQKEITPLIMTDRTALKQALINIVGSAIKNSPRKGEIDIRLTSKGEEILFECRDKGYSGEQQSPSASEVPSLNCLALEASDMEKLIKSLGGTFSALYKPYTGNTFALKLSCQDKPIENKNNKNESKDHLGNIISFPQLKQKK